MSQLLDRWLQHYDPIHRGWTPLGIANGLSATNGFAFPRVGGGYNLYRRSVSGEGLGDPVIVGAAGAMAVDVQTFEWTPADANEEVRFELRSIGGGGVESIACADGVTVGFDELGQPMSPKPNAPNSLSIEQSEGGAFVLTWRYAERGQAVSPVEFRVYTDNASGIIDFENEVGSVVYRLRQGEFAFETLGNMHGSVHQFVVRAFAGDGTHDGNVLIATGWSNALPPALPSVVLTEIVEAG